MRGRREGRGYEQAKLENEVSRNMNDLRSFEHYVAEVAWHGLDIHTQSLLVINGHHHYM